jgi:hypothetical protein
MGRRWKFLFVVNVNGDCYDHFRVTTSLVWIWPLLHAIEKVRHGV